MGNKTFIAYLDDDNQKREGYVEILEFNDTFVKFITNKNTLTIPFSRVLKIKEAQQ